MSELLERIQFLERLLRENNIPFPPATAFHSRLGQQDLTTDKFVPSSYSSPAALSYSTSTSPADLAIGPIEESGDRERALIQGIDRGNSKVSGLDTEIEILAKRTGSLQFTEDGQLKFFGATSNVHFLRTATPFHPDIHRWSDTDDVPETWLQRAGVGGIVPREVEDHLIKLYFTWENPYSNVVHQDAFLDARKQALSGFPVKNTVIASYYSELLVNAM